jgi:hypothetical protein
VREEQVTGFTVEESEFMVDAGNIAVLDSEFIREHGGNPDGDDTATIDVEPGTYRVTLIVRGCWKGRVKRSRIVKTRGHLVVGDACYSWSDAKQEVWDKFLDLTDYLKKPQGQGVFADTGGDGFFRAEVTVEPVEA